MFRTRNLLGEPYKIEAERADQWHDQRMDREAEQKSMQQKRYLENLLHLCSDQQFGQDAIEWAILSVGSTSVTISNQTSA